MNIYDFLRKVADRISLSEVEQREAAELINQMQDTNVFGNMAERVSVSHTHQYGGRNYPRKCIYCDKLEGAQ